MRRAFYYYRDYSARQGASCFWKRSLLMQCHQYQLVCLTPCCDSQASQHQNACASKTFLFILMRKNHNFFQCESHLIWSLLNVVSGSFQWVDSRQTLKFCWSFLDKHKIASENATVIKENDIAWSLLSLLAFWPRSIPVEAALHAWPRSFFSFLHVMAWQRLKPPCSNQRWWYYQKSPFSLYTSLDLVFISFLLLLGSREWKQFVP